MSRGLKNNNPGNIRHDKDTWRGELKPSQDDAFKQFVTMSYGYRAMFHLINNYKRLHRRDTLRKIINRYAPPNENDTGAYVNFVSKFAGVQPDAKIDTTDKATMIPIISAMSQIENGEKAVVEDVLKGWTLFEMYRK